MASRRSCPNIVTVAHAPSPAASAARDPWRPTIASCFAACASRHSTIRRTPSDGDAKQFAADYTRRFGQAPTPQAALSYDAAMLIGRAALAVGPDRQRIRDWVASVGRPARRQCMASLATSASTITATPVGKPVVIGRIEP